jgi:glutathione S-transferase
MMTLIHAPHSRSTRILSLIEEMGLRDRIDIRTVNIPRQDGTGHRDPANPHPEGKVPVLLDGDTMITESGAIMLYLTQRFPGAGLAPRPDEAGWARYLTWMVWYGSVMEPVLILQAAGITHPWLTAALRGPDQAAVRIRAALEQGPWLLGDRFSAADVLVHSPYSYFPDATPDDPLIRDWVARCVARPARARAAAADGAMAAAMVA